VIAGKRTDAARGPSLRRIGGVTQEKSNLQWGEAIGGSVKSEKKAAAQGRTRSGVVVRLPDSNEEGPTRNGNTDDRLLERLESWLGRRRGGAKQGLRPNLRQKFHKHERSGTPFDSTLFGGKKERHRVH